MTRTLSFRDECRELPSTTYLTHGTHSYPAKLIPHIPYYFINKTNFVEPNGFVLDPFCGSGTVLVEAKASGRNSYGIDINPLARLMTKVKTTALDPDDLNLAMRKITAELEVGNDDVQSQKFKDIDYWFSPEVQIQLTRIKRAIEKTEENDIKDFFKICFSAIIRRCSFADPRISPACKSKRMMRLIQNGWKAPVFELFNKTTMTNIRQNQKLSELSQPEVSAKVIGEDAKKMPIGDETIDLVITSPPYINAQKYVRSTKLEIFWLDLSTPEKLGELDHRSLGTERATFEEYKEIDFRNVSGLKKLDQMLEKIAKIDRRRAYIAHKYFREMGDVLLETRRVLKNNGHFVLVIGNNRFYGIGFPTSKVLIEMAKKLQFTVESVRIDPIRSRGLMTKRNKTADMISCEWVLVFRK